MKGLSVLLDKMRRRLRCKNEECQRALDGLMYQSIFTENGGVAVEEIALLAMVFELVEGILDKDYELKELQSIYNVIFDWLHPTGKGYENEENSD